MIRVSSLLTLAITTALLVSGCGSSSTPAGTSAAASADVVAVIDNAPFTRSTFEAEYARSVGSRESAAADSMAAYEDFLERYVNYRIKVLEAKEAGLERDSSIVAELASYRSQYAKPYLINQKILDPIIRDLYARKLEMVEASHILLLTKAGQSPADTLALFEKISAIRDSALAGVDFGDLAVRHSEDPSAAGEAGMPGARGYLGFFTSGAMVPQFEDVAYGTPIGQISPVFRTRFGYHIMKVTDRKATPADITVSHIMITPKGQTPADTAMAKAVVDSLYQKVLRGDDFAALATAFSDDKQSGTNGGRLGTIGYGSRLVPVLKDAAFALAKPGDLTEPILTRFGYHIIRLDDVSETQTLEDAYDDLKTQASRSPRAALGERMFADSVLASMNATFDSLAFYSLLTGILPDSVDKLVTANQLPGTATVIAVIDDSSWTMQSVAGAIPWGRYRAIRDKTPNEIHRIAVKDYLRAAAIDHELAILEDRDPSFKATMNEFRNGILLFRLMEDSVWTAAATDTVALMAEYNRDPTRFNYPDRSRLVTYFSTNKAAIERVADGLDNGGISSIPDSVLKTVRIDTTYLAGASNSIYDRGLSISKGAHTGVLAYNSGSIVIVNDGIEAARQKTFDESRAELINLVQTQLEDRLVARLRQKYGVRTFPMRLNGVFAEPMATDGTH